LPVISLDASTQQFTSGLLNRQADAGDIYCQFSVNPETNMIVRGYNLQEAWSRLLMWILFLPPIVCTFPAFRSGTSFWRPLSCVLRTENPASTHG